MDSDEPAVLPDDTGGGRLAAEHLLGQGRRRFGHITGPERFLCARKRARGFCDTVAVAGVDFAAHDVLYGEWSERWGRQAVRVVLGSTPDVDAIFCGSDQIARGVTDTLRQIGKRVPEDIAVVGYDNWSPMVLGADPPLTSVDMCLEHVGRVAAEHLLLAINGEPSHGVHTVPCRLVPRDSTASSAAQPSSA
jgi:LacI family transcriptional regulator